MDVGYLWNGRDFSGYVFVVLAVKEALWVSLRLIKPVTDVFGRQIVYIDYNTAMI